MAQDSASTNGGRSPADLFHLARGGDHHALGRLLNDCRDYLLLIANQELDDDLRAKESASDIVQETFLEAHRDFGQFSGNSEAELRAWLRHVLLNNVANVRRKYRDTDRRQITKEVLFDFTGTGNAEPLAGGRAPSSWIVRQEESEALERAIAKLPEHYRQVVVWRHKDECSFAEIGSRLQKSPDAARMLWWRAFERLADELERD